MHLALKKVSKIYSVTWVPIKIKYQTMIQNKIRTNNYFNLFKKTYSQII